MARIDSKTIEEYKKALAADPNSKVFAVLGEAYRELGIVEQAENILRRGIARNPNYAAGYIVLSKICLQRKEFDNALKLLTRAVELSPDNLLAFQLLGETHILMKNPKEALKAHKMALFLNPINPRSQQVVRSLEKVTADEFEEDLFSLRQPQILPEDSAPAKNSAITTAPDLSLDRSLSLIDALIVRQQTELAHRRLLELQKRHPGHPELRSRLRLLEADEDLETAAPIRPIPAREKRVINEKIQRLQRVLTTLEKRLQASP